MREKLERLKELLDSMGGVVTVYITKGEAEIEGDIELDSYLPELGEAREIIDELLSMVG